MRIDEFEFQDRNGNEIEPTKNQLVVYVKSLHKQIAELKKQLEEKEKEIEDLKRKVNYAVDDLRNIGMRFELETFRANKLQDELKSQPAEIVEKIKNYKGEYFEWKIGDKIYPAFKITEEDLDNILKECKK